MSSSPPRYVFGGGMRIDYLITRDGQAHTGLVGGNALYAAAGAAVWTDSVGLWGRIGENYPTEWLDRLSTAGLSISGLQYIMGQHDHRTFYAYTADGKRDDTNPADHFARIGQSIPDALESYVHSTPGQDDPTRFEPLALRPTDWPSAYGGVPNVHLGPLPIRSHLEVPPMLRQQGVRTITVDPGERYMKPELTPYLRQILPGVDAFLPSEQEIRTLFGPNVELSHAARTLCKWGVPLVVVKRGSAGLYLRETETGTQVYLPAYHQREDSRKKDVTGAGDAFCGGFMVGLDLTGDPFQAALYGSVSASLVIEGYGAMYVFRRERSEAKERLRNLAARVKRENTS